MKKYILIGALSFIIVSNALISGVSYFQLAQNDISDTQSEVLGVATTTTPTSTSTPIVRVIYPNGGENLTKGSQYAIKWNTSNAQGRLVNITLVNTTSGAITTIAAPASNIGTYNWTVPITATSGSYKIRITLDGTSYSDTSDAPFNIPPTISVEKSLTPTSPVSGETWSFGKTYTISWTSKNLYDTNIAILGKEGLNSPYFCTIAYNIPATQGSFSFAPTKDFKCLQNGGSLPAGQYVVAFFARETVVSTDFAVKTVGSVFKIEDVYGEYVKNYIALYQDGSIKSDVTSLEQHSSGTDPFVDLATQCTILTEAYKKYGDENYKQKAINVGNILLSYKDMDNDGKAGWGLMYSWDAHGDGSINPANTSYMWQTGKVVRCLSGIYEITKNQTFINTAKQAIDDSWNMGTSSIPSCVNCFFYAYSYSPNDQINMSAATRLLIRNTNLEMAWALFWLNSQISNPTYYNRAVQVLNSEMNELNNGNDGYYSINYGGKVGGNLTYWKGFTENHYPHHALYFWEIGKMLGDKKYFDIAHTIMNKWENCKSSWCVANVNNCSAQGGNINTCGVVTQRYYSCAMRDYYLDSATDCAQSLEKGSKANWLASWPMLIN